MKKPVIALAAGLLALVGFAIWGLNQTKPKQSATPTVAEAPPAETSPSAEPASPPPPPRESSTGESKESAKRIVEQRLYKIDEELVKTPEFSFDASKFNDRVEYGDIDAALAKYQAALKTDDENIRLNALSDLAYQPAESQLIHAQLLMALQSEDETTRTTAYETILVYEDATMVPALKAIAENHENPLIKAKAQECVAGLEATPMRERYFQSKKNN